MGTLADLTPKYLTSVASVPPGDDEVRLVETRDARERVPRPESFCDSSVYVSFLRVVPHTRLHFERVPMRLGDLMEAKWRSKTVALQ